MDKKTISLQELIDNENKLVIRGQEKYGDFFINAQEYIALMHEFLKSADVEQVAFVMFLGHIKKHLTLALLSITRLHSVQAMMNLRQVLEGACVASYVISFTKSIEDNKQFIQEDSSKLKDKSYKWIKENFPAGSDSIQRSKKEINKSQAHANIVYASQTFVFDFENKKFVSNFFDKDDDYHVKSNLWLLGNITMIVLDLFYGVNQKIGVLKFSDDFLDRFKRANDLNQKHKEEMMNHERYIRTLETRGTISKSDR